MQLTAFGFSSPGPACWTSGSSRVLPNLFTKPSRRSGASTGAMGGRASARAPGAWRTPRDACGERSRVDDQLSGLEGAGPDHVHCARSFHDIYREAGLGWTSAKSVGRPRSRGMLATSLTGTVAWICQSSSLIAGHPSDGRRVPYWSPERATATCWRRELMFRDAIPPVQAGDVLCPTCSAGDCVQEHHLPPSAGGCRQAGDGPLVDRVQGRRSGSTVGKSSTLDEEPHPGRPAEGPQGA